MVSSTTNFKLYLNKIMGTIPDEIHDELWEHLIECIKEKEQILATLRKMQSPDAQDSDKTN